MKDNVFLLVGGLGFFFFGMRLLSEGLKKVAGQRLRNILTMITKVPIVGILVGTGVTCLIQSSSATTVMVVGFVNAGLLALKHAISVVIGANIGTTFTAWLVSSMSVFKITHYSLPAVGIGFVMMTFAKSRKTKSWGEVLLGFGILFTGLDLMKDAFEPLKNSEYVKGLFATFSDSPLLGILVGVLFTVLLQSSSATIAIVQVLAFNGIISFPSAIPLILGDNIGTTVTAQMAAVGTNINARRVAMSHTLFNVIGVLYMLFFLYTGWFAKAIDFIIPGSITTKNIMFHIAIAHSSFNIFNALIFLPFIGLLEKASVFLVPKPKGLVDIGPQYLEKHLLETPPLAMQQVKNEISYMLSVSHKAIFCAVTSFIENDPKNVYKVADYERATDNLQSEITQYVIELSQRELSEEESQEIPVLIHIVNDIERIGDHAGNISELAQTSFEEKPSFPEQVKEEFETIWEEVRNMFAEVEKAFENNDVNIAYAVLEREERINKLEVQFKAKHFKRLNNGICKMNSNFLFLDFIDNMEKTADHLTNIAQGIIGKMQWTTYKQEKPSAEAAAN